MAGPDLAEQGNNGRHSTDAVVAMDISWLDRLVILVLLLAALYWTAKRCAPVARLMTHAAHHACVNPCLDALCTVWAA